MSPTLLCWQHHRLSLVLATGTDARNYLHRRSCNDVTHLAVGQHQLNAVLERKAELRALFDLYCLADDTFLLLTETATAETLLHELNRFVITEDVRFTLLPPMALLASLGELGELPTSHPLPSGEGRVRDSHVSVSFGRPSPATPVAASPEGRGEDALLVKEGFNLPARLDSPFMAWGWLTQQASLPCALYLLPLAAEASLTEALAQHQWLSPQQATAWQHVGGVASFAQGEWDADTLLPALGVEPLAVSTTKGCYLGQETVAKLHTYGNVPKRLLAVLWETCPLPADALPFAVGQHLPLICTADGQQAGQLVSLEHLPTLAPLPVGATRPWLGLALLKRAYRTPDTPLVVQGAGEVVSQQVASFPLPTAWWQQATLETLESESDNVETQALALHRQATACYLADQGDEALALLDEALALHPTCWPALESKGVVLGRLGRTHEAIAVLKAWQAQQPNAVMAYSNLSLCYAQLGDKETAETYKAEATRLTMRLAMQAAMAKKQASGQASSTAPPPEETTLSPEQRATLEQRAELLQHALSVAPNDALALYGLGSTYFSLGQYQQAVTYLEQTVAVSPKHSKAYAQLATALLGLQQTAQAEAVAKQGLAVATTAGDLQVVAQLNTLLASLPALQGLG